ncbi:MAG: hypothetical protein WC670_13930 [Pseudolabrys sp.]|jgi:hypothetical protein
MIRTALVAAVVAASFALAVPGPAQARMADPGLNIAAPTSVEHVQYRHHRRYYGHPRSYRYGYQPYRAYGYYPGYRRCWTQRVHTWNGWRYVRRCR